MAPHGPGGAERQSCVAREAKGWLQRAVHTGGLAWVVHTGRGLCPHFADRDTEFQSSEAEPRTKAEPLWPPQGSEQPCHTL